jgi:hypothetical protein
VLLREAYKPTDVVAEGVCEVFGPADAEFHQLVCYRREFDNVRQQKDGLPTRNAGKIGISRSESRPSYARNICGKGVKLLRTARTRILGTDGAHAQPRRVA